MRRLDVEGGGAGRRSGRGMRADQQRSHSPLPVNVLGGQTNLLCSKVSCGMHHSAALSTAGVLYTWGKNISGCLGREVGAHEFCTPGISPIPVACVSLAAYPNGPICDLACGRDYTVVCSLPWGNGPSKIDLDELTYHSAFKIQIFSV